LAKKKSLKEALKPEKEDLQDLLDVDPAQKKEESPLDRAAKQAAEYVDIKERIKGLEKQAEALKADFEPVVKPLAENGTWLHKGVQVRWIEAKTQSAEPQDFYELAGDSGLPFLIVSVTKARKAIEAGILPITQEQLDKISSWNSYERFEAKIVSLEQAAKLFALPF